MEEWSPDDWDPRRLPRPLLGGEYHFEVRVRARAAAMAAIESAEPPHFGAALREIQDSCSHWGEGRRMPLDHSWHWLIV